jgi:hypothetical protein
MVSWWDIVKFIRCLSRRHLNRAEKDYVQSFVKKDVPWDNLAALAELEGVAGFFYYHLKDLDLFDSVSQTALKRLEDRYNQTKKYTLAVVANARALADKLEQTGIPVMVLQGLSLTRLYGDKGLRPLGDVDLMVKPGHKEGFKQLLGQAGYQAVYPAYPDILYKDDLMVDIHTHVLNLDRIHNRRHIFPADLTPMWEKAVPFFEQQDGLLLPDPFDNFVALAAHALKHSYSRLIWLVDLHECLLEIGDKPGGWGEVVKRVRFWQQERIVLYALILVENIFGLQVPLPVKQELGIGRLNILEKHLLRLKLRGFSSRGLCYVLWLCNIRGAGNKLKFIKETVFPKDEVMAQVIQDKSWSGRRSGYFRRVVETISLVSSDLHRAFTF